MTKQIYMGRDLRYLDCEMLLVNTALNQLIEAVRNGFQ